MKTKHALLLMILLTVSSVSLLAQTITSDKEDYSPGEVAIITGTGWTSDQFVDVHFEEDPVIEHHHGYHDIAVDEDGNFTIYYDILDRHLGVKFTVTAVGQQSGLSAFTIFYDGNISINGNANGATVNCPGAPVTLTAGAFNCKDAVGDCFSWYRDNGDGLAGAGDAFLGSTTSGTFNTTAPAAGTYKYYVVGYQNGTASASELDLLTVSNTPLTTAISLTGNNTTLDICSGTSTNIQFSNGPSNGIVTYNINGGSDQTVNLNAGGNASFSSGALTSQTTYNLVSVSAGGCSNSVSGSVVVNINTAPVLTVPADISVNNDPELCSASVSFLASVTGTPTPSIVYSIAGSPVTSPYVFPVGTTTVTVTATNTCGTDIETFNVTVVDNIDPTITAPAGFTITADAGEDFATGVDLGTPATADNCAVATVTNDAVDPLPVGTHLITWTVTDVNGNSATAEQVVIVEPSIIYITVTADAVSKTYGDADPELTYQITSGALGGSDVFTGSLTRVAGEDAGEYDILLGSLAAGPQYNYEITFVGAKLTITQRSASVTPDAASKIYGDADPAFTGTLTGFLVADGVTAVYNRTVGETVLGSPYTISAVLSPAEVLSNYDITYNTAEFTIDAKAASVTPDAASKTYGDADPAFTGTLTGFLVADGVTAVYSRTAGETVAGSPYTISAVLSPAGVLSNYSITYNTAIFTINQRPITIAAVDASKFCGQTDPTLTYSIAAGSVAAGETLTVVLTRETGESAGTYAINGTVNIADGAAVNVNSNYDITYTPGVFTINGISVTVADANTVPVAVGNPVTLTASVSSAIPGSLAGIPVVFVLDDGNAATAEISITGTTDASGFVSVSLTGLATEVYKITVTAGSACASTIVYKPIYDPSGGFVTGGGWIMSLPGSYPADAAATGKAHFGFVSKYKKGSNVPEGNTEFQFHAGNLNFASSSYNSGSLVVAGSQAIYKGVGTINGSGSYQFMVSVVDGSPDKFRMKITNGSTVVYDNNMGADENANAATALGGGSIVIHAVKGKATEAAIVVNEIVIEHLNVYPNPVDETINVSFASPSKAAVNFNLVDMNGRSLVAQTDNVNLEGKYSIPVGNLGLRAGLYVLRVSQESTSKIIKVIKK